LDALKKRVDVMETMVEKLSRFVYDLKWSDIPKEVIQKAKTVLLNGISIGIANYNLPNPKAARELIRRYEPGNDATLIGEDQKVSLMGAAFANGALFHARGQEDTHGTSHLGTMVIPSVLAVSEYAGTSGKDFLLSVIIGYEIAAALGKELTALSTARGFRASSIYGILGVASGVSKILGYRADQIKDSLAMAAAFAGGTTETFYGGGNEWVFENGMAARNGMMAAFLPQYGMVGVRGSLDGVAGFCQAFAGTRENLDRITAGLGKTYEILNVTFKPYPSCAFNQTPITAMFNLITKYNIQPEEVERIEIHMNPYEANYPGIKHTGPVYNAVQCAMSPAFAMGVILVDRKHYYSDIFRFDDPNILSLCKKTTVIDDKAVAPLGCRLSVWLRNGKELVEVMDITPEIYFFDMEKVIRVIEGVHNEMKVPPSITRGLIEEIKGVETWSNVKNLIQLLNLSSNR
jgi:2-methylcitrate dehydratase PrpD